MSNKFLLFVFSILLVSNYGFAQEVCGTYEGSFEADKQKYPVFYQSIESINSNLEKKYKSALSKITHSKSGNEKKIIPVVVHIIHDYGSENLTEAEIQNGIDHLNANINGQAWNFLSTVPDIFAAVRGVANIEFRLAKIDPDGDPTNGIVRIPSKRTIVPAPRNETKTLSYWNSYEYLNIWVVGAMPSLGPDDPALNGYAQFPWSGSMSTDGVMIRSGVFKDGETITHEVGHWLGLCHTWDCGGGTCGSDNVIDTPKDREGTFDFNGTFPFHAGLAPPPGITGAWGCVADSLTKDDAF